jgi:hypothetical protein
LVKWTGRPGKARRRAAKPQRFMGPLDSSVLSWCFVLRQSRDHGVITRRDGLDQDVHGVDAKLDVGSACVDVGSVVPIRRLPVR